MEIKTLAFNPGLTAPNIDELYSDKQRIVYPQIRAGIAIPIGQNARNAGFYTGVPLGRPFSIIDVVIPGRQMH